jgi:hypothetical protein
MIHNYVASTNRFMYIILSEMCSGISLVVLWLVNRTYLHFVYRYTGNSSGRNARTKELKLRLCCVLILEGPIRRPERGGVNGSR